MMIYNSTVKSCEHIIPIIENLFLSSLISLRNGFVLGTNICISILNELEINQINNKANTVAFANALFLGTPCMLYRNY